MKRTQQEIIDRINKRQAYHHECVVYGSYLTAESLSEMLGKPCTTGGEMPEPREVMRVALGEAYSAAEEKNFEKLFKANMELLALIWLSGDEEFLQTMSYDFATVVERFDSIKRHYGIAI